jgi:hypothetical protein
MRTSITRPVNLVESLKISSSSAKTISSTAPATVLRVAFADAIQLSLVISYTCELLRHDISHYGPKRIRIQQDRCQLKRRAQLPPRGGERLPEVASPDEARNTGGPPIVIAWLVVRRQQSQTVPLSASRQSIPYFTLAPNSYSMTISRPRANMSPGNGRDLRVFKSI